MNKKQYKLIRQGVKVWNEWRRGNLMVKVDLIDADLRGTDLRRADLSEANLSNADLSEAKLFEANLSGAYLRRADLSEAKLIRANLSRANLSRANLSEANLSGAYLREADLSRANLREADLSNTNLSEADLSSANLISADLYLADLDKTDLKASFGYTYISFTDLSRCKNLASIRHYGPSIIDIKSVKFDYKNLPEKFLSGCGLKKWQIEAIKLDDPTLQPSEVVDIVYRIENLRNSSPIQPHSLFISYTHEDEFFVEMLEEIFKINDIKYWRDVHNMTAGPMEKQIEKAISINETFLLILSENSVNSDWVEFEVRRAREAEKNANRHVLCPIALDDSWKDCKWPRRIKEQIMEYNVIDFSNWQDEAFFKQQYAKLLKGLNIYYRDERV